MQRALFILFIFKVDALEVGSISIPLTKTENSVGRVDMETKRNIQVWIASGSHGGLRIFLEKNEDTSKIRVSFSNNAHSSSEIYTM